MAINVNEFRKGNYANYSYQGTDVIFYGYNYSDGCFTDFSSIPIEPEELDPIPLTEELLIKLGFEKDNDADDPISFFCFGADFLFHRIEFDGEWYLITDEGQENRNVQYLHQLQNLYFALTGTELITLSGEEKI